MGGEGGGWKRELFLGEARVLAASPWRGTGGEGRWRTSALRSGIRRSSGRSWEMRRRWPRTCRTTSTSTSTARSTPGRTSLARRSRRTRWTCVVGRSSRRSSRLLRPAHAVHCSLPCAQMVLNEEGERAFYTAQRSSKRQSIPIWVPGRDQHDDDSQTFPQPPAFMMHHSPNTLATQPPALWTRLSPSEEDANGIGEALRPNDPKDPPKEIQADQTGVPQMSPPDRDAEMGGSLDSMGDVEFEVTLMEASSDDDDAAEEDREVYVLDEQDGLTMELADAEGGEVEVEVWVTGEVSLEEYEEFVRGSGRNSPAVEFEDEEVEGAIREYSAAQTPRHVSREEESATPSLIASGGSGNDDSAHLTPFEPMSKQPVLERAA